MWLGTLVLDLVKQTTIFPHTVADMYSLEPLKRICMLRIPKLLSVDNVIETLSSLAHNEGLGMLIVVKILTL